MDEYHELLAELGITEEDNGDLAAELRDALRSDGFAVREPKEGAR